jgi:large subunit ribosomal protein L21
VPSYAVIALGGKQYRVQEGERLLVDRLAVDEGAQFEPRVLMTAGDGGGVSDGGRVTATVEEHLLGPKIRIFFYKAKGNWNRRRGHRSRLSRVRIDSIGTA